MNGKKNILNIILVSLNDKFCKNVATSLSEKLDMFVADCHEMIVYDLINPKDVIDKCGIEYFKKRECSVVKNCSSFLNTVLSINFELFKEYYQYFNNSLTIYLHLKKDKVARVPNKIDYQHRNDELIKLTDFKIDLEMRSCNIAVKKIMEKLGENL